VFSGLINIANTAEDGCRTGVFVGTRKAVQQILVHPSDMPALIRYGMMDYNVERGCHSSTSIHHISDKKKWTRRNQAFYVTNLPLKKSH
jgi:hypothetical protein